MCSSTWAGASQSPWKRRFRVRHLSWSKFRFQLYWLGRSRQFAVSLSFLDGEGVFVLLTLSSTPWVGAKAFSREETRDSSVTSWLISARSGRSMYSCSSCHCSLPAVAPALMPARRLRMAALLFGSASCDFDTSASTSTHDAVL